MIKPDKELEITIYEDIEHLINLWNKNDIKNSDIRNSVHILRRLLIYNDLQKSANTRKIKLTIECQDVKPFIKANNYGLIEFFQSGGTKVFGIEFGCSMIVNGESHRLKRILRESDDSDCIELNITSFLRQMVFSFKGDIITRGDIIKYVANKAGSAHYDKNRDKTIDKIRSAVDLKMGEDGIPIIGFNYNSLTLKDEDVNFEPKPGNIDPVFIEVAAAARYLTESKSVKKYCELLKNEYNL